MDELLGVDDRDGFQNALADVGDGRLLVVDGLADVRGETASVHELRHDLPLTRPPSRYVDVVVPQIRGLHAHHVRVLHRLLDEQLQADLLHLRVPRDLDRHRVIVRQARSLVPTLNTTPISYTLLYPPSPMLPSCRR